VRVVVPLPPGSIPDLLGRAIGRAPAGHAEAAVRHREQGRRQHAAGRAHGGQRAADGYTLMVPTVTTLSLAPQLITKPGIDPLKDLTAIALLGATNFFLCVHPSFPAAA
jgi:tripartite-type tricarboxylate transporter receptor subunit TctC